MEDEVILRYKDTVLRQSDIDILKGAEFLSDQIIGFYFRCLETLFPSEDILLVQPTMSFWLANCDDQDIVKDCLNSLDLSSKRIIMFTVNNADCLIDGDFGSHWSLLAYNKAENTFVHHDSMEFIGLNNDYAAKLFEVVKDFVVAPADDVATNAIVAAPLLIRASTPEQSNCYDCGLYVMAIAKKICEWHGRQRSDKGENWLAAVGNEIDTSVESTMRSEVLEIIKELQHKSAAWSKE